MKTFFKAAGMAVALVAGMALAPQAAYAQSVTLVVDVDQLYKDSVAAKSGGTQLEAKYGAKLKSVQSTLETAVKGWNEQVEAAKKVAKPDGSLPPANEASLAQARQTLNDSKSAFDEMRQEIQYADQYVKYQILDKLIPIAEKIRKDRKAGAVVPRGSVLAFDPANDITAVAMQQLNATTTTVSITPPQQQQAAAPPAGTAPAQPAKSQPQTR
ncbi:MAG: hypothetical protein B7Y45_08240 [Sphingomonas sp. 28-66-16]|nr:MAG: hypothetical protein B7Y45_08240 [Sphingomonas sp. 28-66-16]